VAREALLRKLVDIQYERTEELRRGTFRVRGDRLEIYPPYEDNAYAVELWGSQVDAIRQMDPADRGGRSGQKRFVAIDDLPEIALRHARRAERARHPHDSGRARLVGAGA